MISVIIPERTCVKMGENLATWFGDIDLNILNLYKFSTLSNMYDVSQV